MNTPSSIYEFEAVDIQGEKTGLERYKGKVLLIVNVASRCGFTPQYRELQQLYDKYKGRGFEILAFPCNDFGGQEPEGEASIRKFCDHNYQVDFDLFSKIKILVEESHPLYRFLQKAGLSVVAPGNFKSMMFYWVKWAMFFFKGKNLPPKNAVQWNFHKFLINRQGRPVANFASDVNPLAPELTSRIEEELGR